MRKTRSDVRGQQFTSFVYLEISILIIWKLLLSWKWYQSWTFTRKSSPHLQAMTYLHVLMQTHVCKYSQQVCYTCAQVGATHGVPPCPNPILPEDEIMKSHSRGNNTEILNSHSHGKNENIKHIRFSLVRGGIKNSEKSPKRQEREHQAHYPRIFCRYYISHVWEENQAWNSEWNQLLWTLKALEQSQAVTYSSQ